MILWIQKNEKCYPYSLKNTTESIFLESFSITITKQKNQIFIRVPRECEIEKPILKNDEITSIKISNEIVCKLMLICCDEYDDFKKYSCEDRIMIGSSENCDISIDSKQIPFHSLIIDFRLKQIHCIAHQDFCSVNSIEFSCDSIFLLLDVIQIYNLKIILLDNGIMMNTPVNVNIHLQEYISKTDITTFSDIEIKRIYNRVPVINHTFVFQNDYHEKQVIDSYHKSIFLEIGPSLLMSSASLFTGLLSAYQSYLNGRELISILPMIILPSVMCVSTLLFYPLTRLSEKKRNREIMESNQLNKQKLLRDFESSYIKYQIDYKMSVNKFYPSMLELIDRIKKQDEIYVHSTEHLYLRLFESEHVIELQADDVLLPYYKDESLPYVIDCNEYRHILIDICYQSFLWLKYIILQISTYYDVLVVLAVNEKIINDNLWMRMLPNTIYKGMRMICKNEDELQKCLLHCQNRKRMIISFIDSIVLPNEEIFIQVTNTINHENFHLFIDFKNHEYFDSKLRKDGHFQIQLKDCDMEFLLFCLRRKGDYFQSVKNDFYSVHAIDKVSDIHLEENWKETNINQSLLAMIGIDEKGNPIVLDLNEKGDGPHGLIAGMTGSGKSELIVSMLLSISLRYSYLDVEFALIDFKGGGAANILKTLPHVCGTLSNLDTDNMERALVSFRNTVIHRQKMISKMNEMSDEYVSDITTYRRLLKKYPNMVNIPEMIIVIDEFAELKRIRPDFLDDLISISRIGRSLGIHLILCTQKPNGIISDEIWSNCSFQIALKVSEQKELEEILRCKTDTYLDEPGEFLLHSNHHLRKGKSCYSKSSSTKNSLEILDMDGSVINTNDSNESTQLKEILRLFDKYHSVNSYLWLQPLDHVEWNKNVKKFVVGKVDDYYRRQYLDLYLFSKTDRNFVFLCSTIEAKIKSSLLILYVMMHSIEHEQLFVIDDLNIFNDEQYNLFNKWIMLCSSYEEEKVKNTFQYLRKDESHEKILLITDLSRFYESNENNVLNLRDLLEHASVYHLYIILLVTNVDALYYRDQSFIQNRFVVQHEDHQQIQQFLRTSEKVLFHNASYIKKDHILPVKFFEFSYKQVNDYLTQYASMNGVIKTSYIPCMPSIIDRREYKGTKIPIGISYKNYKWKTIDPTKSIYVVSSFKEELVDFMNVMKCYAKCTTRKSIDEDDGQCIFLSLEEYKNKHYDYPVLYVGTSFRQQYYFHSKYKIQDDTQAILLNEYESELIKIL